MEGIQNSALGLGCVQVYLNQGFIVLTADGYESNVT